RENRRSLGRRHLGRGRAEGHWPLDGLQRDRSRRAAHWDYRSRLRSRSVRAASVAHRGREEAAHKQAPGRKPEQADIDAICDVLYASKIVAYAQGFQQMTAASKGCREARLQL